MNRNRFQVLEAGTFKIIGVYHFRDSAVEMANDFADRSRLMVYDLAAQMIVFRNWL